MNDDVSQSQKRIDATRSRLAFLIVYVYDFDLEPRTIYTTIGTRTLHMTRFDPGSSGAQLAHRCFRTRPNFTAFSRVPHRHHMKMLSDPSTDPTSIRNEVIHELLH